MKLASPRSNQSSRNKFEKLCYTAHQPPGIHPRGWWTTNWILLKCPRLEAYSAALSKALGSEFRQPHFWHFGHQKVERPFWVNRLTMPPQRSVWHFSPS